jgi:two-component system chemotaxis response regulator CheY
MSDTGNETYLLVVDDQEIQRRLLQGLLRNQGYVIETANDGEDALQKILTGKFHIMLTDWEMPGMDGATLCRRVREANLPTYVYIVMLTGHTEESDVVAGFEAGVDDYLSKPPKKSELIARLNAGKRIVRLEQSLRDAYTQIHELSMTDTLCGTFNRRYLDTQLLHEIERAIRYGRPLSLIVADLDLFKRINDELGHQVGDEVLRHFASLCLGSRRRSDWVARYGGEEFVIVLPETNLGCAVSVAEKTRVLIASQPAPTSAGNVSLTASFGVAELSPGPPSRSRSEDACQALIRAADNALYTSKREGRNRVTAAAQS